MSGLAIGNWVKRKGVLRRHVDEDGNERWIGPRWHLVESVVAEDAVIRCGKRMDRVNKRGVPLEVRDDMPLTRMIGQPQLCHAGCAEHEGASDEFREDDGSTHGEVDVP
jgi:hypothetical protein